MASSGGQQTATPSATQSTQQSTSQPLPDKPNAQTPVVTQPPVTKVKPEIGKPYVVDQGTTVTINSFKTGVSGSEFNNPADGKQFI
jgi:hypothetical protein